MWLGGDLWPGLRDFIETEETKRDQENNTEADRPKVPSSIDVMVSLIHSQTVTGEKIKTILNNGPNYYSFFSNCRTAAIYYKKSILEDRKHMTVK